MNDSIYRAVKLSIALDSIDRMRVLVLYSRQQQIVNTATATDSRSIFEQLCINPFSYCSEKKEQASSIRLYNFFFAIFGWYFTVFHCTCTCIQLHTSIMQLTIQYYIRTRQLNTQSTNENQRRKKKKQQKVQTLRSKKLRVLRVKRPWKSLDKNSNKYSIADTYICTVLYMYSSIYISDISASGGKQKMHPTKSSFALPCIHVHFLNKQYPGSFFPKTIQYIVTSIYYVVVLCTKSPQSQVAEPCLVWFQRIFRPMHADSNELYMYMYMYLYSARY